jgi:pimeloyl-ACP methyl ester carboxylesterase
MTVLKTSKLDTTYGTIAVNYIGEPVKTQPTLLCIHGNSSSSRIFEPVYKDPRFAQHYHIVAFDLPGHGDSSNAPDPESAYTQGGFAKAAVEVLSRLNVPSVVVLGWSLGGHIAVEMIPLLKGSSSPTKLIGIMIVGTPPSLGQEQTAEGFAAGSPHMHLASTESFGEEDVINFAKETCGPPHYKWLEDVVRRSDGRFRKIMFDAFTGSRGVDQVAVVRDTKDVLCAVVNGANEPFVNLDYLDNLSWGNLWGEKCIRLKGLGHAPFWESSDTFNPILGSFLRDCSELNR